MSNWGNISTSRDLKSLDTSDQKGKFKDTISLDGRYFTVEEHPLVVRAYGLTAGSITLHMVERCKTTEEPLKTKYTPCVVLTPENNEIVIPLTGVYKLVKSADANVDADIFCHETPAMSLVAALLMGGLANG